MTAGEKMRQQVLNAISNAQYLEGLYFLKPSDRHYNSILEGIKVLVKGLPSVDRRKK